MALDVTGHWVVGGFLWLEVATRVAEEEAIKLLERSWRLRLLERKELPKISSFFDQICSQAF